MCDILSFKDIKNQNNGLHWRVITSKCIKDLKCIAKTIEKPVKCIIFSPVLLRVFFDRKDIISSPKK